MWHGGPGGQAQGDVRALDARGGGGAGPGFAKASGHEVDFDFGTVGALQAKLDAGETADVVILSVPGVDKLEQAGALVPGSRKNVAKTFIALCIRGGVPKPDFSTVEAFKRLLEGAKAIATSDPAVGGSAGVHLARMFEQQGLAAMMAGKSLPQQTGAEVARCVVEGKAEFGLTLSGEVASVPGAVIAGALPPPFGQDHHLLRGGDGGERVQRCGGSIHRGADNARHAGDLDQGRV